MFLLILFLLAAQVSLYLYYRYRLKQYRFHLEREVNEIKNNLNQSVAYISRELNNGTEISSAKATHALFRLKKNIKKRLKPLDSEPPL